MRDVLNDIMKWWDAGETFGLATVVQTYRSALFYNVSAMS